MSRRRGFDNQSGGIAIYIITVDDEYLSRMDIEYAIRDAKPDAELLSFEDPFTALDFVREDHVDVAYIDVKMPGMSGLELAEKVKKIRPETNIIFSTGYAEYALDAFSMYASGYLLKPITAEAISESLKNLRSPLDATDYTLRVQCFGNFEVFADGKPLHFPRQKAKELFAYLIHKHGGTCTTQEVCTVIYKTGEHFSAVDRQIQTQISAMMKVLNNAGAGSAITRRRNSLAVNVEKIDCDYYRFLNREKAAIDSYMGEYMSNYSWAEFKTEYLDNMHNSQQVHYTEEQ